MTSPYYAPPSITTAPPAPPIPPQTRGGAARFVVLIVIGIAIMAALVATLISTAASARKIAYPPPVISISTSATDSTHVNDAITFQANVAAGRDLSYQWNFGDGAYATGASVTHAYQDYQQGGYTVSLVATDPLGQTASVQRTLAVLPEAPTASFTYATDPYDPLTIDFDASNSTGADLSYQWDFGDGNSSQDAQTSNTYAQLGTYQVTLTVTDVANQTASTSQQVMLQISAPTAAFTVTQISDDGFGDACYDFDASASTGYQLTYNWVFGDGYSEDDGGPQISDYCYYGSGDYTVQLTVVDGLNRSASASHSLSF